MTSTPEELIQGIKAAVEQLEWSDDWMALDKELGQLDLLVYKLRQIVIQPKEPKDLDELLREIGEELK